MYGRKTDEGMIDWNTETMRSVRERRLRVTPSIPGLVPVERVLRGFSVSIITLKLGIGIH